MKKRGLLSRFRKKPFLLKFKPLAIKKKSFFNKKIKALKKFNTFKINKNNKKNYYNKPNLLNNKGKFFNHNKGIYQSNFSNKTKNPYLNSNNNKTDFFNSKKNYYNKNAKYNFKKQLQNKK